VNDDSSPHANDDSTSTAPTTATTRRGSAYDVSLHYSVELWTKARAVNRGRAVLACLLAHVRAMRRLVEDDLDLILEDNVRVPIESCAARIWHTLHASTEASHQGCHLRYHGWLGSIPNLQWMYQYHIPRRKFSRKGVEQDNDNENNDADDLNDTPTVFPFPTTEDIENDLKARETHCNSNDDTTANNGTLKERDPGGNPVWGCYAYWVSRDGYEALMERLRNDVGAMVWKSKRARFYTVKPIDKILPRLVLSTFGSDAVHLSTHPSFFRAPMLTSKIHTQWDPEFCKSSQYQMQHSRLSWSDVWLTSEELQVVEHYRTKGTWSPFASISPVALEENGKVSSTVHKVDDDE
jgi:GR25 family glycosyltransferase involved in LPS biosynthesis